MRNKKGGRNSLTEKGENTKRSIERKIKVGAGGGRDARRAGLCTGFNGTKDDEVAGGDQKPVGGGRGGETRIKGR